MKQNLVGYLVAAQTLLLITNCSLGEYFKNWTVSFLILYTFAVNTFCLMIETNNLGIYMWEVSIGSNLSDLDTS